MDYAAARNPEGNVLPYKFMSVFPSFKSLKGFTERCAFKNYKCDAHGLYYQIDLYRSVHACVAEMHSNSGVLIQDARHDHLTCKFRQRDVLIGMYVALRRSGCRGPPILKTLSVLHQGCRGRKVTTIR